MFVAKGTVWKFGDNISTDHIKPGFTRGTTPKEQAAYCMQAIRPEFAQKVKTGDVIVGGKNFGSGSSRPAAQNFMTLGVSCVVAESFSRLFFRSSINLGFPLLYCTGVSAAFTEGDVLEADFEKGVVRNLTSGKALQAEPLHDIPMQLLRAGGVVAMLRIEYQKSGAAA